MDSRAVGREDLAELEALLQERRGEPAERRE